MEPHSTRLRSLGIGAALAIGLFASGCVRFTTTPIAVFGPYRDAPTERLLESAASALTRRGYQIQSVDPASGQLTVTTWTRIHSRATLVRVQVYREGWVQVIPQGPAVRRAGVGSVSMPSGLCDEYADMTAGLMDGYE